MRKERKEEDGGEARGEGEGRWRVGGEDRGEDRGGYRRERIEDTEEGLEVTEEACEEDERCEEESECHSAAKRARVCATFTDSQENAIDEFVRGTQSCTTGSMDVATTDRGRRLSGQKSLQN